MESLEHILYGFTVALAPNNLLFLFLGALLGTVVGLLPGIGPAAGIGLLLPVTFGMDPIPSLIMLAGIYYGSMYGNTVAAVLINTPGTASAAMTTLDGYPMARQGRGGAALAIAAIASFVAGTLGVLALTFLALPLADFALQFGPAEYFALMLFALSSVSVLVGDSFAKGLISTCIGLAIATIGIDLQSGQPRFTMGVMELQDGVHLMVVIVGVFAVAEVFISVEKWFGGRLAPIAIQGKLWMTRQELGRCAKPIVRGGLIGFIVGVLPGGGGTIATVLSYATEKKLARDPSRFGHGAPEGVAGPEAANNAATCGAFVPMLTLGVPGSGTTAVLLAAFIMLGIQPGPLLFQERPDLVWGLINSMYLGNIVLLVLNLPLAPLFARILYMPPGLLLSLILAVASVGVYTVGNSVMDLYLLLVFGILGYGFRKLGIPAAPMVLALVLGAFMEQSFRQAMAIGQGDPRILLGSPICVALLAATCLAVFGPLLARTLRRTRR